MTSSTLQYQLQEQTVALIGLAKRITWNKISGNCFFVLSEIKNATEDFDAQRKLDRKQNSLKTLSTLDELIPTLQSFYDNIYDTNLYIYKVKKHLTIIDIRYYLKSSLDEDYGQKVLMNEPMLHYKIFMPPWLENKNEKFDINWQHKELFIKWKLFWAKMKLRRQSRLGTH